VTDLDDMTKAELLERAKSLGVSPANNDMTKDELRAAIEQHEGEPAEPSGEPGVEGQATTTATKDFLGRALITPAINSKDYLGRPTQSAIDYLGRLLLL
jgi:hypothetical protein